ncbi:hypothetical protein D3C86_2172370 [compost metagenome]
MPVILADGLNPRFADQPLAVDGMDQRLFAGPGEADRQAGLRHSVYRIHRTAF